MPMNFYLFPLIMIGLCGFLIYRCFTPYYFGIPEHLYNRRLYTEEQMYEEARKANKRGYLLTAVAIVLSVYLLIPYGKDFVSMIKGEYIYTVVKVRDEESVYLYPEYVYNREEDIITYDSAAVPQERRHAYLEVGLSYAEEGEYYLICYLPETKYGQTLYKLENFITE